MRRVCACLAAALLAACASAQPAELEGERAEAWGYVRLVPRQGVEEIAAAHAYGDREVADASFVDYTRPGFAVVYAEGQAPPPGRAQLEIRTGVAGAVFEPPHAALGVGGTIAITNQSGEPHAISCPNAGLVRPLAAGESIEIEAKSAGEWPLFLLDSGGVQARVFAAPGPFQVTSPAGRFELLDLAPGRSRLHAWHPRFPPASVAVDLGAGESTRVDLELRVDAPEGVGSDAP